MRTETINIYQFSELSEKVKTCAIDHYRNHGFDYNWYEFTKGEFEEFLTTIGFEGVTTQFSGFWSQGDGASFDFKSLDFAKLFDACWFEGCGQYDTTAQHWRDSNATLIRQARRVTDRLFAHSYKNGYATHYCHQNTRAAALELDTASAEFTTRRLDTMATALEDALTALMRNLAIDYYKALESEYESLTSDDSIAEVLSEYEFTADGDLFVK